jgi:hypothetical protein
MDHQHAVFNAPCDLQRELGLSHGLLTERRVGAGEREARLPPSSCEAVADRAMDARQRDAGLAEPALQVGDAGRIGVVQVGSGSEELEHLESVRADLAQMLSRQPLGVEQVRGNPERPPLAHD